MYEKTGMTINGKDIYALTDSYIETFDDTYEFHEATVDVIYLEGIFYEYTTEYCTETITYTPWWQPYTAIECAKTDIMYRINNGDEERPIFYTLDNYLLLHHSDVTHDELLALDFIKTREYAYTPTTSTIGLSNPETIYTFSDTLLQKFENDMHEYVKILYEDDYYKYVYTYQSPYEYRTTHCIIVPVHYINPGGHPKSIPIDIYISENLNILTWEDIEATGLGVKVPKVQLKNII